MLVRSCVRPRHRSLVHGITYTVGGGLTTIGGRAPAALLTFLADCRPAKLLVKKLEGLATTCVAFLAGAITGVGTWDFVSELVDNRFMTVGGFGCAAEFTEIALVASPATRFEACSPLASTGRTRLTPDTGESTAGEAAVRAVLACGPTPPTIFTGSLRFFDAVFALSVIRLAKVLTSSSPRLENLSRNFEILVFSRLIAVRVLHFESNY